MFRGFVHMLTWAGVVRVSTVNLQRLRQAKGMVVIANHPTLIDVVVLISLMPNAGCIVKQGLWRNPFLRGVVSAAGYIPIAAPSCCYRTAVKCWPEAPI